MSAYELFLFAHLLFVITWLGTDIAIQVLSFRALASTPERQVGFMQDVEWLGQRLLIPAGLLVLVFGFLLVNEIGYEVADTWILLALAGYGFSFLLGAGFLGPETGRIGKLVEERGAEDPEVSRRIRRLLLFSRFELVVLLAIVLDMIVKPGL
jgi:uncharacterized membrane protein